MSELLLFEEPAAHDQDKNGEEHEDAGDQPVIDVRRILQRGLYLIAEHARRQRAGGHSENRPQGVMPDPDAHGTRGDALDRERRGRHHTHREAGEQAAPPQHDRHGFL